MSESAGPEVDSGHPSKDATTRTPRSAPRGEAYDFLRALSVAMPPAAVCAWLASERELSRPWIVLTCALGLSALLVRASRAALRRRVQTVASVLASYREGDFSIRARAAGVDALLHDVLTELNELGDTLRKQRLGEMEAWALLRKVMAEIDVVILAVDDGGTVRLANEAASRSLGLATASIVGRRATELGLDEVLSGAAPRVLRAVSLTRDDDAPSGGPWELRRGTFRLSGEPHTLVVLSDVSSALRDNERDAWRRLIRVMSHEINNSLSPIQSMSETLLTELAKPPPRSDSFEEDLGEALAVIARRSEALARFMGSYARLAKLPPPKLARIGLRELVDKVARLEQRLPVEVLGGPDGISLSADQAQLEQALINLIKNATEASLTANGRVRVAWTTPQSPRVVDLTIEDDGPGVADASNLFVPFFTTKPDGSGIGLVLSREIIEAHRGELTLSTRPDKRGAIARVRLPIDGVLAPSTLTEPAPAS